VQKVSLKPKVSIGFGVTVVDHYETPFTDSSPILANETSEQIQELFLNLQVTPSHIAKATHTLSDGSSVASRRSLTDVGPHTPGLIRQPPVGGIRIFASGLRAAFV
jgi:ABC-type glutathione transport system ATPase component